MHLDEKQVRTRGACAQLLSPRTSHFAEAVPAVVRFAQFSPLVEARIDDRR
jgi:hypothetical protein